MKKAYQNLFKTATYLRNKYAIDASAYRDEIKRDLEINVGNASTSPHYGIIPFRKMLAEDQATMNINVTRDGNTITVSVPNVNPPDLEPKYAPLPEQIKAFLEKYIEIYPYKRNGEYIDYNNFTVTLQY
jgi:Tfp pilus assembly protein PilP